MQVRDEQGRLPRLAAAAVLAFSVVLAGVEIGRIAVTEPRRDVFIAIAATAIFLPLHIWHLRYGLRGERPPRSGATLALVAAAHLAALLLIGPAWSFMLATLATSALIVLPPRWALAAFALCAAGPALGYLLHPDLAASMGNSIAYLMYSVVFRACIQFMLVWLVAAAHQLAATRSALAQEAAEGERARVEAEVRASLERGMAELVEASRRARAAVSEPGRAAALVAIDRLLELSRVAVDDLRRIVSDARAPQPRSRIAASALACSARSSRTPIGRGLAMHAAWLPFAAVHAVVLIFLALRTLGVFYPNGADAALVVAFWLAGAAIQLSLALAVARGRRPRHPAVQWLLVLAVVVVGELLLGPDWLNAGWLVSAGALLAFGRRGVALAVLAGIAHNVAMEVWAIDVYPGASVAFLVWNSLYFAALFALAVIGLSGSAYFVKLLAELAAARAALAEQAVQAERRRLSADLHDVLSQTLTAIALKGDLARRVLARDPARAFAELDEVVMLATGQAGELNAVARGEREIAFDVEAANAIELLRAAGIEVEAELAAGPLDAETSMLFGLAVREGATNILRHASSRRCSLRAVRTDAAVELELHNDGAGATAAQGTGLRSLAERAAERGGRAEAAVADGRFTLRVTLPERVYA